MKKTLLTLLLGAAASFGVMAQGYTFTKTTGTYADLPSPTVITTAGWDDMTVTVYMGFPFTLDNITTDSVSIDTFGDLFFSTPTLPIPKAIIAYEADMLDRGIAGNPSNVSYQLTGSAGSRIFKIQYKNVGFWSQSGPIANEFSNFQVWLYEGSNKIEMHYGSVNVSAGLSTFLSPGSSHGIVTDINATTLAATGHFLTGAPATPTMTSTTIAYSQTVQYWIWPALTGVATNGSIFTFNRTATGVVKDLENAAVSIFPNPATDKLHFSGLTETANPATIRIYDALGKVIRTEELAASKTVNINTLPKGTYFVEVTAGTSRIGKQVIKL